MSLSKLPIKLKYQSIRDQVLEEFFVPVLKESRSYKRSAGYFSSKVLLEYIEGLEEFILNNGKMYLLISPTLSQFDAEVLLDSLDKKLLVREKLSILFKEYKETGPEYDLAAKIMLALIKEGYLTIKVVVPKNPLGIYHEKIALFEDALGYKIATNGSNNETANSVRYNIESFNTFCSWKSGQWEYVKQHEEDFEAFWYNNSSSVSTLDLEDAVEHKVLKLYETQETISEMFRRLKSYKYNEKEQNLSRLTFKPFDFQKNAALKWIRQKKGIISYATGVGKTKTAVYAIYEYLKVFQRGFFIIVVPDKTLAIQWSKELQENSFSNFICFSDNHLWRQELTHSIDSWKFDVSNEIFVIVTKQTFGGESFQKSIKKLKNNYVFIVDECHHMGTNNFLTLLPDTEYRLGLSATPEIYMQEERTQRLDKYFEGILDTYNIKKAIDEGFLVPYEYYPIVVTLTEREKELYDNLTKQIVRLIGTKDETKIKNVDTALEMLLFKRAKIVYGASEKIKALDNILLELSNQGHFLVYCGVSNLTSNEENESAIDIETHTEAESQLTAVNNLLNRRGIVASQYTQKENSYQRDIGLKAFKDGDIKSLVAIRCLDEGVDIPEVKKAIIMASSGNPREFVQRRGRLLRKHSSKEKAVIYDMIVFSDQESYRSINRVELKRLEIFAMDALNAEQVLNNYELYIDEYTKGDGVNE